MNKEYEFFMAMNPPRTTAQMARSGTDRRGNHYHYKGQKLKAAERQLCMALARHRPETPAKGPVRLEVEWIFRQERKSLKPKITRPDTDNLQKLLKDCMTKCGFWTDDALVYNEHVIKYWGPNPGINIKIVEE